MYFERCISIHGSDVRRTICSRLGALMLGSSFLLSCTTAPTSEEIEAATQGRTSVSDLYVVDCLLPGQVRQLGGRTYISPRRPTRTTAGDCRIRGGEYVAYDRANTSSALNVWMSAAKEGDADAQNYVGEIYMGALGDESDYAQAAFWFQKAADQGHSSALLSLGSLYEQGLGVSKDTLKALNLYRLSQGIEEDDLMYQSAVNSEIRAIREELQKQIDEQRIRIRSYERQISELESQSGLSQEAQRELETLRAWVGQARSDQLQSQNQLAQTREPSVEAEPDENYPSKSGRTYSSKDFGRYYALVIGNQDYERMEDLASPISDANRVAAVLQNKYGFTVQLIQNANDLTVMTAMNNLRDVIGENDNLLIYYAGHGSRIQAGEFEMGYWLPTNADRPPNDSLWVPTEQITKVMATTDAKRVLVVADSCYAGLLGNDLATRHSVSGDPGVYRSAGFVEFMFPKKSRLLVSSGGDSPVLDDSGNGNSVFANAFLDVLESNNELMTTHTLFIEVRNKVYDAAAAQGFDQNPEIKALTRAGHESGDFFFVPDTG